MNLLRSFIVFNFLFISVLVAQAADLTLTKADFVSAKEVKQGNEIVIWASLSKTGHSKVRSLNQQTTHEIEIQIAGEKHMLNLKAPIKKDEFQMGPFSVKTAKAMAKEINGQR